MVKLPPEIHLVSGTKGRKQAEPLPDQLRQRIPVAEWLTNPDAWSAERFINETADYLFDTYGIGSSQDRHVLAMLAEQIGTYILCGKHIAVEGLICETNDGKTVGQSPYIAIRRDTLAKIIGLMNELGLTPKSRLSSGKPQGKAINKFLSGVAVK